MNQSASATTGQSDWRSLSACRREDPELFFPIVPSGPGLAQLARAKAVCASCEVRAECLSFAVETVQDHGVWGGLSEEERRARRTARLRREGPSRHQARQDGGWRQPRKRAGATV
jgi:WhiB family redox-sensing transcriptional regulator